MNFSVLPDANVFATLLSDSWSKREKYLVFFVGCFFRVPTREEIE